MHNHDYLGCKHNLNYCSVCDMVYCTKCYKEWKSSYWITYYPSIYSEPYRVYGQTQITYGTTEGHSHE